MGLRGRSGRAENLAPPPGFDPGLPSPSSVAIPTKLPGPHSKYSELLKLLLQFHMGPFVNVRCIYQNISKYILSLNTF